MGVSKPLVSASRYARSPWADPEAELDAIVAMLEDADLIEPYVDEDGRSELGLTERGAQLGRAMAMAGEDVDVDPVLGALLDARGADTPTG